MGMASALAVPGDLFGSVYCHLALCVSVAGCLCDVRRSSLTVCSRPESPRWLVRRGLFEEARLVVAQTNGNGDLTDPVVVTVYKEIIDTLKWEKEERRTMSPREIIRDRTALRRLLIGSSVGPFSCIAGNIIASYYLGAELDTAGITDPNDQLKAVGGLHPT